MAAKKSPAAGAATRALPVVEVVWLADDTVPAPPGEARLRRTRERLRRSPFVTSDD